MEITGDYHTHTQYSHGKGTVKDNIESASNKGLKEIAITDHGPRSYSIIRLGVDKSQVFLEIKNKVCKYQKLYPDIKILTGVEANIINKKGELDVEPEILETLDLVAAGFHLFIKPPDFKSFKNIIFSNMVLYRISSRSRKKIRTWNTETMIKAVKRYDIDFITHPGYGIDIDTCKLAEVCSQEETCLEINSRHIDLSDNYVKKAAETEVKFIINSDAHKPDQVGDLKKGIEVINKLGIDKSRIFNLR